jgi:hypothetical protein
LASASQVGDFEQNLTVHQPAPCPHGAGRKQPPVEEYVKPFDPGGKSANRAGGHTSDLLGRKFET